MDGGAASLPYLTYSLLFSFGNVIRIRDDQQLSLGVITSKLSPEFRCLQ